MLNWYTYLSATPFLGTTVPMNVFSVFHGKQVSISLNKNKHIDLHEQSDQTSFQYQGDVDYCDEGCENRSVPSLQ